MKPVFFLLFAMALCSCDRPKCVNDNPVFEKYNPESNEYKAELIRQLNGKKHQDVDFWIDKYSVRDGNEYMTVYVQDGSLCAKAMLDITTADRQSQYKAVKGVSYSGAGLKGLKYRIDSTNGNYNFVFEDVSRIED